MITAGGHLNINWIVRFCMGRKKPLGYYNYTVILTYLGMLLAFTGMLRTMNGDFAYALVLLMLAGICDMFDGTVASTNKKRTASEKKFGIQIDSLSDMVCFGVMPAVFVYLISEKSIIAAIVSAFYTLSALIRLAYFNVSEEERQNSTEEKRKFYDGVPVTTISMMLPLMFLLQDKTGIQGMAWYLIALIVCGVGFISPVHVKKPGPKAKIVLIAIGITELVGVLFIGWNIG